MSYHEVDLCFTHEQWTDSLDAMRDCIQTHLDNGWRIIRNYGSYSVMCYRANKESGDTHTMRLNMGSVETDDELIAISFGGHVAIVPEIPLPVWDR